MLILRVTQDIPANTEITLAYKDPIPEFDEERTRFRSWNFVCDCPPLQGCPQHLQTHPQ